MSRLIHSNLCAIYFQPWFRSYIFLYSDSFTLFIRMPSNSYASLRRGTKYETLPSRLRPFVLYSQPIIPVAHVKVVKVRVERTVGWTQKHYVYTTSRHSFFFSSTCLSGVVLVPTLIVNSLDSRPVHFLILHLLLFLLLFLINFWTILSFCIQKWENKCFVFPW